MKRASELEFLEWLYVEADFGPAHWDVKSYLIDRLIEETGKLPPEGYDYREEE